METVKLGRYRHYKGKEYEVVGLARHSETLEPLVVYRACYASDEFGADALWVRPLTMFMEKIVINGEEVSRFERIGN